MRPKAFGAPTARNVQCKILQVTVRNMMRDLENPCLENHFFQCKVLVNLSIVSIYSIGKKLSDLVRQSTITQNGYRKQLDLLVALEIKSHSDFLSISTKVSQGLYNKPELSFGVQLVKINATKPPTIVNWKIISQTSQKAAYQIIRKDDSDKIYMSFGAILKYFSRDDLIELYRLVIKKYGANRPEEMYDRVLWGDLKTMFDPPLSDDAIWSLPLQQKIINWRYYPTCDVYCLTLDASTIYMLADRKYPLSKDACQVMIKMKLLDGTMDEVCYQLLKMIEKQVGIRK
ncbi:hypothetical protein Tco_1474175 [Tanacetum coccineum]